MRAYLISIFLALASPLFAAEDAPTDTQAVMERAVHLNELLDRLLEQSNHSSIHKAINDDGAANGSLIDEALRLKSSGEQALADGKYLEAAMLLQAALDHVFQAVRAENGGGGGGAELAGRLQDAISANDTFLAAAARVVESEENAEARELLGLAEQARAKADADAGSGDIAAALDGMEASTQFAQQAIMSARNGKVIERGQ